MNAQIKSIPDSFRRKHRHCLIRSALLAAGYVVHQYDRVIDNRRLLLIEPADQGKQAL